MKDNSRRRSGCKTCRSRKVKCDEQRPRCKRCILGSFECRGYDTFVQWADVQERSRSRKCSLSPQHLLAKDFFGTSEEHESFHFFRMAVLESQSATFFDSGLWDNYITRLATQETSLQYAMVALGSAVQLSYGVRSETNKTSMLRNYDRALTSLRERIDIASTTPADLQVFVTVTVMLTLIEARSDRWENAERHLNAGLSMLYTHCSNLPKEVLPLTKIMHPALQILLRLKTQMAFVNPYSTDESGHIVAWFDSLLRGPSKSWTDTPTHFNTLCEAADAYLTSMRIMRKLFHDTMTHTALSPEHEDTLTSLLPAQTAWLTSYTKWTTNFHHLLTHPLPPSQRQTARFVEMHHITCKMLVSTALSDGHETIWDTQLPDFRRISTLAKSFIEYELTTPLPFARVSVDFGILPVLSLLVRKCRDPGLRREGLGLLRRCKHREAVWDSAVVTGIAERVVEMEEGGLGGVREAGDVPEWKRHHQVTLLPGGDGWRRVLFRRRGGEGEERWVEYVEEVFIGGRGGDGVEKGRVGVDVDWSFQSNGMSACT